MNLVTANQMHLFSELDNSPLHYHGSSMQIQGQGMSTVCGPASPPSKRQHNISMNDIQKHVKSDLHDNPSNRSIDMSKSSKNSKQARQESPSRLQYVTFQNQKRLDVVDA